jgi:hypothetical protein
MANSNNPSSFVVNRAVSGSDSLLKTATEALGVDLQQVQGFPPNVTPQQVVGRMNEDRKVVSSMQNLIHEMGKNTERIRKERDAALGTASYKRYTSPSDDEVTTHYQNKLLTLQAAGVKRGEGKKRLQVIEEQISKKQQEISTSWARLETAIARTQQDVKEAELEKKAMLDYRAVLKQKLEAKAQVAPIGPSIIIANRKKEAYVKHLSFLYQQGQITGVQFQEAIRQIQQGKMPAMPEPSSTPFITPSYQPQQIPFQPANQLNAPAKQTEYEFPGLQNSQQQYLLQLAQQELGYEEALCRMTEGSINLDDYDDVD